MLRLFFVLFIFIFSSCGHLCHNNKVVQPPPNQCLKEYTVTYEHRGVPDWYATPEGFCQRKNHMAVPFGIGLYPLKYKGIIEQGNVNLVHEDSWVYVVWGCYGPCDPASTFKKQD